MSNVKKALAFIATTDWPTVLHRAGSFMRELRGDGDTIEADQETLRAAARKTRQTFEDIGRRAVGCVKPNPCTCAFCAEETAPP